MSEAPERIWAEESDFYGWFQGEWFSDESEDRDQISYVLASVADEDRRKLGVAVEALRELLGTAEVLDRRLHEETGYGAYEENSDIAAARAALAAAAGDTDS